MPAAKHWAEALAFGRQRCRQSFVALYRPVKPPMNRPSRTASSLVAVRATPMLGTQPRSQVVEGQAVLFYITDQLIGSNEGMPASILKALNLALL